jgi:NodT family efflux transporter outer membrane factor (OMF) lipoprotein
MMGPSYRRPSSPVTPAFKEAAGWRPANPSDAAERGDWWTVFGDPVLNDLEAQVNVSNQTLAAAEAAYRQARGVVAQDRAALFPTLNLNVSASASHSGAGGTIVTNGFSTGGSGVRTTYQPSLGASWAPDIWGTVRRAIQGAKANAQASAATLANARLSAQTELALDYIQLRQLDEEQRLLEATAAGYARTLTITQNRYKVGVAARGDVLSAQSQYQTELANLTDLTQQRARSEHAIAILAGRAPATLTLAAAPWNLKLPDIPAAAPSALLERRPDIASAERAVAAANAQIGVQTAAFFPTLSLTGQGGFASSQFGQLFSASTSFWSVGAGIAQSVFDAGLRRARVAQARAAYDEAVANYRQTVLTAFGQVEDALAAQRVLAAEEALRTAAAEAAVASETITRNQYAAGTVDYTSVVVAQAAALSARNAALAIQAERLATAVNLIEALGGGWTTARAG